MNITYDKSADAIYIEFSSAEFAKNKIIDENTIIDLDKEGKIIGIELLSVRERIPDDFLKKVKVTNLVLEQD